MSASFAQAQDTAGEDSVTVQEMIDRVIEKIELLTLTSDPCTHAMEIGRLGQVGLILTEAQQTQNSPATTEVFRAAKRFPTLCGHPRPQDIPSSGRVTTGRVTTGRVTTGRVSVQHYSAPELWIAPLLSRQLKIEEGLQAPNEFDAKEQLALESLEMTYPNWTELYEKDPGRALLLWSTESPQQEKLFDGIQAQGDESIDPEAIREELESTLKLDRGW